LLRRLASRQRKEKLPSVVHRLPAQFLSQGRGFRRPCE
jgi:hypothetical protein